MSHVPLNSVQKEFRRKILQLAAESNEGHIASAFSIVETLIAINQFFNQTQDRLILSKGHACLSLYIHLMQQGYHPKITGHPDIDRENGVSCTTGSLGHGLPIATGMALAMKLKDLAGNVYVIMGDGECNEGTLWESLLIATHHNLSNLTIIIDNNRLQAIDLTRNILSMNSLRDKFLAFNCATYEVDGHSVEDISKLLMIPQSTTPKIIIAHTIKGKGLSFMENRAEWHNRIPNSKQMKRADRELR